jgi:hypothetical protein
VTRFDPTPPPQTALVERDPRIGWALLDGPDGERWVRDRDRFGWGQDHAYSRWTVEHEVERLRSVARYERVADCWLHGDRTGMMLAVAGPAPLVALDGGKD